MANSVVPSRKTLQARIVSGSIVLLSGSGLNTAINLAYNIAVARFLGPKGFGHATVIYTILVLLSAITLAFQLIATKIVAQQPSPEAKSAVYRLFHRASWICGIVVALGLVVFQGGIADYLNLPAASLVSIIAIGAAFYVPLGARRGYIQGSCGFRNLAANLVTEQTVRLLGSLALISMGWGLKGVIAANSAAIAIAYYTARVKLTGRAPVPIRFSHAAHETFQAAVFFSGQMIINNGGIVLVNHFFLAREAGYYAAVAMVGRVIFSFSQAVVNSTFPLVAGTSNEERRDLRVIATALLLVLGVGAAISVALCIAPAELWTHLFGADFAIAGKYNLPYLLALYALATVIYSLAGVIITFEMSYKIANTSWVQLAFSGVLLGAISIFHSSLREVVLVQLFLMVLLFAFVAIPFLINSLTDPKDILAPGECRPLRLIRRISEDATIAEFLKSDFHVPAFRDYHKTLSHIVMNPNFGDPEENAKRRALFYIRHSYLWREIPQDTEWYEVDIAYEDLAAVRMFPRAQWRKVANGRFSCLQIAEGLQKDQDQVDSAFVAKLRAIGSRFNGDDPGLNAVILIGTSEAEPLTVIDGNHRLTAALMHSPNAITKLRFICGLSPRMTECCWYRTNLITLFRYAKNVLTHSTRNPAAELARML
ncbi:MAG TPA: oligosaccharide flippase family protein [Terracidiphilus sp.]|nr:oligosaccharide flippase family protein [Terracidiphilus sp.]